MSSSRVPPTPAAPVPEQRRPGLWWLSPWGAVLLLVPATLLVTHLLDDDEFRLFYRSPKTVTGDGLLLAAAAALVLAVAAVLAASTGRPARSQLVPRGGLGTLRRCTQPLFWVTLAGYGAFFGAGVLSGVGPGDVIASIISQDNYAGTLRGQFTGFYGLTTLTQVGIAFVIVGTYVLVRVRDRRLLLQIGLVLLLSLVRSYVNSERLALVEVAVPAIAVVAMSLRNRNRLPAAAARLAPLALAPLLFVVFAVFEYSRSWQFFAERTEQPFGAFAAIRLLGYYATAYNNGALNLEHDAFPGRLPDESLAAFWQAPGIAELGLYERLSAPPPDTAQNILERFGNPEFNNPGGLTTPFVDFGIAGGFLALAVAGLVLGLLYRGFRQGAVVGALLYPLAVTGLLDLPRYIYWTQGRVVPAVAALLVVAAYVLHRQRRQEVARRKRPRRQLHRPGLAQRDRGGQQGRVRTTGQDQLVGSTR